MQGPLANRRDLVHCRRAACCPSMPPPPPPPRRCGGIPRLAPAALPCLQLATLQGPVNIHSAQARSQRRHGFARGPHRPEPLRGVPPHSRLPALTCRPAAPPASHRSPPTRASGAGTGTAACCSRTPAARGGKGGGAGQGRNMGSSSGASADLVSGRSAAQAGRCSWYPAAATEGAGREAGGEQRCGSGAGGTSGRSAGKHPPRRPAFQAPPAPRPPPAARP